MLIGRDAEFGALVDSVLRAVAGQGYAVCVEGEAGIGKTALVDAVAEAAVARHPEITVLRAVGIESEFSLGHAGLLDLLNPVFDSLTELPGRQQQALSAALGRSESAESTDRFFVAVATLGLLSAAADRRPLLLIVDDLPWIDPETSAALQFSARRIRHDRIAMVFTRRSPAGARPRDDLTGIDRVELTGLRSSDAERLFAGSVSSALIRPLVSRTGGNPLALLELSRSLTAQQRRGSAPLPAALPVGNRLTEAFSQSIAELSPAARRAATLAAACVAADTGPLVGALDAESIDPGTALADAETAGVLVVDGSTVVFRHPLLRNATWQTATVTERRSAHATLAAVLPHRPGSRLRHLAEAGSGPDDVLGAELLALARDECGRSGYAAASMIAERASALLSQPGPGLDALADALQFAALSGDLGRVGRLIDRITIQPQELAPDDVPIELFVIKADFAVGILGVEVGVGAAGTHG